MSEGAVYSSDEQRNTRAAKGSELLSRSERSSGADCPRLCVTRVLGYGSFSLMGSSLWFLRSFPVSVYPQM